MCHKKFPKSYIINPFLTKRFQSRTVKNAGYWPCSFFVFKFVDLHSVLVYKLAKKELCLYPAILTSRLVNNPYVHVYG